jgi:hypothetical protein
MANQWFRFYNEAINDPKVQILDGETFKAWVNILCLASIHDGKINPEIISFYLRKETSEAELVVSALINKGLLIMRSGFLCPNGWEKRQYISDNGKARVKRHREKRKEMGLPAQNWISPVTRKSVTSLYNGQCVYCNSSSDLTIDHKIPQSRGGDNNIDNLQIACRSCNAAKRDLTHEEYTLRNNGVTLLVTPPDYRLQTRPEKEYMSFEDFWKEYPRRVNKGHAEKAYKRAIKETSHEEIISGVKRYSNSVRGKDAEYIAHAATWLNGRRWLDEESRSNNGTISIEQIKEKYL